MVLQQVEQEGHINIINIINQLRHKRMKMVQNLVRNHIFELNATYKLSFQSIGKLDVFPHSHNIYVIFIYVRLNVSFSKKSTLS